MSIAKSLPEVHKFFMQQCPLCGRLNRMVVKGVYIYDNNREIYPDIGYSFCNCKCIFYTNYENIDKTKTPAFERYKNPLKELKKVFDSLVPGTVIEMILPDVFFCDWGQNPYEFEHWNPRANYILWDMGQFCEEAESIGFEIVSANHEFDVQSNNHKTMKILLKK